MTSGFYITWFVIISLIGFTIWEFVQLHRRRKGNRSALTMSQFVIKKARENRKGFYWWFVILFPPFLLLVAVWLWFHWFSGCFAFGWLCWFDI